MTALRWPAKRAIDLLGATGGLIVLGPLLLLIALAVRLSLGSPVLLPQVRVGRHGRPFQLLQLRTMTETGAAPLPDGEGQKRLGDWLRSTNLDRLPALINVLRGEMSLVGPGPLLPEDLPRCFGKRARRHELLPGMTGWAEVQRCNTASWQRRFALDVWYVDNWSLGLDLKILLLTVAKVMRREDIGAESSATTPPLDDHALRETAPQAVRGEAHLPSLEAAGWRIKRVHERVAKTAG